MASLRNVRLALLSHDHKNRTAKIRVSYEVMLTTVERNMTGLRYRERIRLYGQDIGLAGGDDYRYSFSTAYFNKETDGIVNRNREVTLSDSILDEDTWWQDILEGGRWGDEIYAKVDIYPILPTGASATSNRITHEFNP